MAHEYEPGTQSASQVPTSHENGVAGVGSEQDQQSRIPVTENHYFQEAVDPSSPFYDLYEYVPYGQVEMCGSQVARYVLRESLPEEVQTQISTFAPVARKTFPYSLSSEPPRLTYEPRYQKYPELRRFIYNGNTGELVGYIPDDVPIHVPGRKPHDYNPGKAFPRVVLPHISISRHPAQSAPENQPVRQGNVVFMEAWLKEKQQ